jgi:hypothetical protein
LQELILQTACAKAPRFFGAWARARFAGMFKDNPDFQEVLDVIAENRNKMDADPDIP